MSIIRTWFKKRVHAYEEHFEFMEPQLVYLGYLGVVGYPLVYIIFTYLMPQEYETLFARITASVCCLPLLFSAWWPAKFKRFMSTYLYAYMFVWVGIFFSYMLNKNAASPAWAASLMFGLIIVFAFVDWLNSILLLFFSTLLGQALYSFNAEQWISNDVVHVYAVLLFASISWSLVMFKVNVIHHQKMRNMLAFGGKLAHDLRTPLLTVKLSGLNFERSIPELVEYYKKYVPVAEQSATQRHRYEVLSGSAQVIGDQATQLMQMINMLMITLKDEATDRRYYSNFSLKHEMLTLLSAYPFGSDNADKIHMAIEPDFSVYGSSPLLHAVIYNLIDNALYAIHGKDNGKIILSTNMDTQYYILEIKDNGCGIRKMHLPHIFEQFYSTKKSHVGTGLGLHAVKRIMVDMGGSIDCHSIAEETFPDMSGTIFTLRFPKVVASEKEATTDMLIQADIG